VSSDAGGHKEHFVQILVTTLNYFHDVPGGMARLASDLAHAYVRAGHEVFVLAQAGSREGAGHREVNGLRLITYYLGHPRVPHIRRHEKHFAEARNLLKRFLPGRPDVIHGHDLLLTAAATDFYGSGGRYYYTVHSPTVEELPIVWRSQGIIGHMKWVFGLPVIRSLEYRILAGASGLAVKSEFTRNRIRYYYGSDIADRIRVIPGWVDLDRFRPPGDCRVARLRLGWPLYDTVFFALRRLYPRMGLENLLLASAEVRREGINFHLVIGGAGPLLKTLEDLRDRLGLRENVTFMGMVQEELLPLAYGSCDAAVMPTEQLEGFGLPILEGMACGRPVLVTPVGAMGEIVRPFEAKWVAENAAASGIAKMLSAYLSGRIPRHEADTIRSHIRENFAPETAYARYLELLNV
jgi:glycosyltransferase involved in cell wall biosynthesis